MTALEEMNHYLASRGLGKLGDAGLFAQLGYMIRDNAHFRSLLMCCDPGLRRTMYECLAPNVHGFKPLPLDVYEAQGRADAEARQLPVVTPDGGLEQYRPPEVDSK